MLETGFWMWMLIMDVELIQVKSERLTDNSGCQKVISAWLSAHGLQGRPFIFGNKRRLG